MKFSKVVCIAAVLLACSGAVKASQDRYQGVITLFAGDFAPRDTAFCEGSYFEFLIIKHFSLF